MFQSTRPARGATLTVWSYSGGATFQSTRPARGATTAKFARHCGHLVSIHAPRAGRDKYPTIKTATIRSFNPRAPRGARR